MTYSGAVHSVINPAELFDNLDDHILNRILICHVHLDYKALIVGIGCILSALSRGLLSPVTVQVGKGHAFDAGLSKSKSSLFPNPSCCL